MNDKTLEELARELAPLDADQRRRALKAELAASPEGELPAWMGKLFVGSRDVQPTRSAMLPRNPAFAAGPPRASAKVRSVRYRSEESDAATLLGMIPDDAVDRVVPVQGMLGNGVSTAVLLNQTSLALVPELSACWEQVRKQFEIENEAEFVLMRDPDVGIETVFLAEQNPLPARFRLFVATGTLSLEKDQLTFLIARSVAQLLYDHGWYRALSSVSDTLTGTGELSPDAEAQWLRWRCKAEISADRAGLLACGNLGSAVRALLRTELGLEASPLTPVDDVLIESAAGLQNPSAGSDRNPRDSPGGLHPLAVRVLAVKMFGETLKRRDTGTEERSLDRAVDALLEVHKRRPESPREVALMNALAAGGVHLLVADRRIDDREGRLLVRLLFRHFSENPEFVLTRVLKDPDKILSESLEHLREHGLPGDGEWLIERLFEIALADETLPKFEISVIARIGESLNVETETLVRLMCEVAAARGQLHSGRSEERT